MILSVGIGLLRYLVAGRSKDGTTMGWPADQIEDVRLLRGAPSRRVLIRLNTHGTGKARLGRAGGCEIIFLTEHRLAAGDHTAMWSTSPS